MKWLPVLCVGAMSILSACSEGAAAPTTSIATVGPTNYATLPPTESTSTTTTVAGAVSNAGQITTEITEYEIQAGDVPFLVATKFKITLDALNLANADTEGYDVFYPGLRIKIPVGATIPDPTATTTTAAGATPAETTTTIAGGGDNCAPGSYVIQAGDIPSTVAKKFDVTVEQLNEANVNTQGYTNFIVGVTIVIPAKADC